MVTTTGVSMLRRMADCTWSQPSVGRWLIRLPSRARILSPARRPAFDAGLSSGSAQPAEPDAQRFPSAVTGTEQGSAAETLSAPAAITQPGTDAIVVVTSGLPKPTRTTVKNTTARTRLWKGPANITMTRCHQGF